MRARKIAREAFRKLAGEEQQTPAVQAFCEGLKDSGGAALVATQAGNSEAGAMRMAAEAITVKSKRLENPGREKLQKALFGVSFSHTAVHHHSLQGSEFTEDPEQVRYSAATDNEEVEYACWGPPVETSRRGTQPCTKFTRAGRSNNPQ